MEAIRCQVTNNLVGLPDVKYGDAVTASVAKVLGEGAQKIRTDAGATLEEVALTARRYGLPWSSGRVGDFEAGRTSPTLTTLIAYSAALGETIGRRVTLSEMITGDREVMVNEELIVDTSLLRAALSGDQLLIPTVRLNAATMRTAAAIINKTTSTAGWPRRLRAVKPELRQEVLFNFTDS